MAEVLNLLFTSVGRRVALLRMFRRAMDELEIQGRIIAVDYSPDAAALQFAEAARLVPSVEDPLYPDALLEIVAQERVRAVFPLIDPDVPVLARMRSRLRAIGAQTATVAESALSAVSDKWEAGRLFAELGIPTPAAWLPDQLNEAQLNYPLFIKPREGSASGNCYRVRNSRELQFFLDYIPRPVIQEYLPGPEITHDVICDCRGEVLEVVSRERMQVRGGEVTVGRTVYDAEAADQAARIARAVGATGPITVQCIMKNGQPRFTEINARLGGGAPCGAVAGASWPRDLIARLVGRVVSPRLGPGYRVGVVFSRYQQSVESPANHNTSPRRESLWHEARGGGWPEQNGALRTTAHSAHASAAPVRKSVDRTLRCAGGTEVYLIGSGGHAKVIWSLLHALGYRVVEVIDDDPGKWSQPFFESTVTGPMDRLMKLPPRPAVAAIGDNRVRRHLAEKWDLDWLTLVHPHACVDSTATLGAGTVVMAGVVVQAEARVGRHAILNTACSVDHDAEVGDFAHVAPGARLAGEVTMEDEVLLGTGAVVIPRVTIGRGTVVGAGAVVTGDLPPHCMAKGVPARIAHRRTRSRLPHHPD